MMNKMQMRNTILLFLTAFVWGIAFVAQSVGMDYIEPFTFSCIRTLLGGTVLLPCIWLLGRTAPEKGRRADKKEDKKNLLKGGILCGVLLFFGSNFQQHGIAYTTVGKAGFITAFYIIIVPILGIFLKKKCSSKVWTGVILALAGMYFLCITEELTVGKGDVLMFIGAFMFALHILAIDHFAQKADGVKMSCIQFFVCGILSGICMFLFEEPQIAGVMAAWQPLLYAGICSCGIGYTLQIIGQRDMNPTVVSLILSLESVISVLAGIVLLNESLSTRETLGCILMFGAIILAQLPEKEGKEVQSYEILEE